MTHARDDPGGPLARGWDDPLVRPRVLARRPRRLPDVRPQARARSPAQRGARDPGRRPARVARRRRRPGRARLDDLLDLLRADRVRRRALAPGEQDERQGQGLDAGRDEIGRAVAVDVGDAAERGLGDDARRPTRTSESNDRTVARCSDGIAPLMNAWRSGPVSANTSAQIVSSTRATTKLAVSPIRTRSATFTAVPTSTASVRRRNSRRAFGTMRPPTICAPAKIAAARPAMP